MPIKCPSCGATCADEAVWCLRCHTVVGSGRSMPSYQEPDTGEHPAARVIGGLLAVGIILLPLVFGWFVFRRGYSTAARAITVGWMVVVLAIVVVRAVPRHAGVVTPEPVARPEVTRGLKAGLAEGCRSKRLPVDCDCFADDFARRATPEQLDELVKAPTTPSFAVVTQVEAALRQCADKGALRTSFMTHCVKNPQSAPMCECVFERALATFTVSEFLEMDEAASNGRPPGPVFGTILTECVANPSARGPVARAAATTATGPTTSDASWSVKSADARATLAQTQSGPLCTLTCAVDGKESWHEARDCEDAPANLHFVASDCERWAVFYARPKPGPVLEARFITVYDRAAVAWHVVGAALLKNQDAVRYQQRHLVAGLGGSPGEPPKYSADGRKVELVTLEGVPQAVPLHKDAPEAPPPKKKRK